MLLSEPVYFKRILYFMVVLGTVGLPALVLESLLISLGTLLEKIPMVLLQSIVALIYLWDLAFWRGPFSKCLSFAEPWS